MHGVDRTDCNSLVAAEAAASWEQLQQGASCVIIRKAWGETTLAQHLLFVTGPNMRSRVTHALMLVYTKL